MKCPRCLCPGAMVGIQRPDCLNRTCPCFYSPLRAQYAEALERREELFSGDSVSWIRVALWHAEESREEAES